MKAIGHLCMKLTGIGIAIFLFSFLGSQIPASSLLYGQTVTFAGTQTGVPTGAFSATFGVAVDERGDVFFPDIFGHAVMEALAVNGSIPANPTVLNLGSGFIEPYDVAVDGSGNVFVAETWQRTSTVL